MNPPQTVTLFSPAKINLFLAVTARRADGYHDIVSVAAPLAFGDELAAVATGERTPRDGAQFTLACDNPDLPCDGGNLVLKAAAAFARATGWEGSVAFRLTKRLPLAAGLGGGSSNATAALVALNRLSGAGLGRDALAGMAAGIGSDCALFLGGGPVVMRGRGERVEPLAPGAARRLRDRRVLVFKPSFGIGTAWAYAQLASVAGAASGGCLPAAAAEQRLALWTAGDAPVEALLFNSFERPVFRKFTAIPALLERLRNRFGLQALLSGSGSACFALLPDDSLATAVTDCIRDSWGPVAFVQLTSIAAPDGPAC